MQLIFKKQKIEIRKKLNSLDNFVIEFISILNKSKVKYVIVSGYVAILFGRNRTSEDVDLILEKLDFKTFNDLFIKLNKKFECLNVEDAKTAYSKYLLNHTAIRFCYKGNYIPNIEVKFAFNELNQLDTLSLNEKLEVNLSGNKIFISPIELQIAFKFFLGSEKDIEDAVYIYEIFKDRIDLKLLAEFGRKLNILDTINKYVK